MSEILTNNKYYKDIADTIRQMKGVATTYKPREMASALRDMYSTEVEGVPPLTFPSNGNNLLNYRIDGANGGVGDRTKNLWNEDYTDIPVNLPLYKPLYLGEGTFTLSTSAPLNSNNAANLFLMSGNVTQGASTNTTGCWNGHPITAIANNGYVTIAFRSQYNVNPADYQSQLEEGSIATDYEPYGYKIPVVISGKNLFNENSPLNTDKSADAINDFFPVNSGGNRRTYFFIAKPNTTYTFSCDTSGDRFVLYEFNRIINLDDYTTSNNLYPTKKIIIQGGTTEYTFTTAENTKMVGMYYALNTIPTNIQIEVGNAKTTYEAYTEQITNIYLNEPIEENESKALSDTNVNIPTINGINTLSIDTTVQPSNVYVQAPKTNNYNL